MTNEKAIMCLEDMKIKVPIPKAAKQARENNEALDVAIKALQSAEPKRGMWERHYCKDGNPDGWQCDKCKEWYYFGQTLPNFCPNCGADMRGEQYGLADGWRDKR